MDNSAKVFDEEIDEENEFLRRSGWMDMLVVVGFVDD